MGKRKSKSNAVVVTGDYVHGPQTVMDVQNLPIEQVTPTPHNPRKFHANQTFRELVANMAKVGLVSPVVVRPISGGKAAYELLAGRRRFEAARELGWDAIPAIVRVLDDREARELTVTENLQREDLTPLEESDGVQGLLDVGWSIDEVADRFGKSKQWVARRARLRELNADWRRHIDIEGHWAASYSAGLLEVIAALPADIQTELLDELDDDDGRLGYLSDLPTIAEMQKHVANHYLHTLAGAPWGLDDDTLVPEAGACTACPKRSSCQPLLFDEPVEDGVTATGRDRCLDASCWKRKGRAAADRKIAALSADGEQPIRLIGDDTDYTEEKALQKQGCQPESKYVRAKAKDAGAVPAVVVSGPNAGETHYVRTVGSGRATASGVTKAKAKAKAKKSQKELEAQLQKRRNVWIIQTIIKKLDELADGQDVTHGETPVFVANLAATYQHTLLRLLVVFGTFENESRPHFGRLNPGRVSLWESFDRLPHIPGVEEYEDLWCQVLMVLSARLSDGYAQQNYTTELRKEADRICELLGWDVALSDTLAEEAIPTPKSWATQATTPPSNPKAKKSPAKTAKKSTKSTKKAKAKKAAMAV